MKNDLKITSIYLFFCDKPGNDVCVGDSFTLLFCYVMKLKVSEREDNAIL